MVFWMFVEEKNQRIKLSSDIVKHWKYNWELSSTKSIAGFKLPKIETINF